MYKDDSLTLHTDLYQINMMQVYFNQGIHNKKAVFEVYFRQLPFKNGFAVFAGLERIVNYLENLTFSETDITYLKDLGYPEDFLDYLANLKLELTINSALEGDLVFANEQILIATKAARIRSVIEDAPLLEFGTRRAQEMDAAIWGTRAAVIGGADATSNVRAGKIFGIPVSGTHAHALVQAYGNDYDAFKAYASTHKDCVFLVDTYDTLKIGVPNAIRVAKELGDKINFLGVRLDSGDLADAKIYASNDLDENTILNLKMQKAKIDVWGVGTKLITAYDQPALGAVYKIVSMEDDKGVMHDTIKLSNNAEKVSTPGKKQVWRITSRAKGKSEGDYITFADTDVNALDEINMFHPTYTYINKTVRDFDAVPLLVPIYDKGQLIYDLPSLDEIKAYATKELDELWNEYKRVLNPQDYPVDLAKDVWDNKMTLIDNVRKKAHDLSE